MAEPYDKIEVRVCAFDEPAGTRYVASGTKWRGNVGSSFGYNAGPRLCPEYEGSYQSIAESLRELKGGGRSFIVSNGPLPEGDALENKKARELNPKELSDLEKAAGITIG